MHDSTEFDARGRGNGIWNRMAMAAMLCLAVVWSTAAVAAPSIYCPTLSANVANGGSVMIDVSACDGPFDGGMSGPIAPFAQHGTVTIGANSGGTQFVTYAHSGNSATSDQFFLEDNDLGVVTVNIAIAPPTSPITVSPANLPALTAGTPFSQALTSAGGTAPYTYTLQSGTLPVGLSLTTGGLISGTPTQRGGYAFVVRSTDNTGQFVDKGYTGTVLNPTLSIAPTSGTAIQTVAFSQTLFASGGVAPHTFSVESGLLPAGISLSSAGLLSGTTSAAPGSYPLVLRVTDSSTGPGVYFELENYTLTVSPPPSVSVSVSPASVSEDGAATLVYTLTRSLNLSSSTLVNVTTGGTATAGTDYTGNTTTVTIPSGSTTAIVVIDPTADGAVEPDETVLLTVVPGAGYTVGTPSSATGTILNDDVPSASIAVSPASVSEDGVGELSYVVTLDQPSPSALAVGYLVGGTATNGTDYVTLASPVIIPAGNSSATIVVDPIADATNEADETVVLTLAAGAGYTVGAPNSATGTILNDDLPTLRINDLTFPEGDTGTLSVPFTIILSSPAGPGGVSFDITTVDGTATAGSDYVAATQVGMTIPEGSTSQPFYVDVNGDLLNEATEIFFVNITNVSGAVVADSQGLGTIVNDDALPSLSINDVTVTEGSTSVTANFTVSLSAPSGRNVTVNYATADGTATAPGDYTALSGGLLFTAGTTALSVSINVNGDLVPEADEDFFVNLSGASNASIADNQGRGTILNDDVPVTVSPGSVPGGTVGVAYNQALVASGGAAPYAFSVSAGALPAGLSLSPSGVLSGTPTAGGNFAFTVTALDSSPAPGPFSGSQAYTLAIAAPTVALPATGLAGGTLGAAYSDALAPATGGTAPYTYAVTAGALPGGLALDASSGAISGTPNAIGSFNFTVTATDSSTGTGPYGASQAFAITVGDQAPIANPVSATVGYGAAATDIPLAITGGPAATVAVATAPSHGTALASGTTISYQPDPGYAGADSFTYTATNAGGTSAPATVSITVQDAVVTVTAGGSLSTTVGAPYSQTFTFNGGSTPWSAYQVTNLPAGLSITGTGTDSVTVSGTPTQAGSFNLNVSATDSSTGNGPYTVGEAFVLDVAVPGLALSPAGATFAAGYGSAYSQAFAASGGVGPYTYAVSGSLPAGVSLVGDTLSGTPTAVGNFSFTIEATDTGATGTGAPFTVAEAYVLAVAAGSVTPDPTTLPAADPGAPYSQALSASGGVAPYAFALASGPLPSGLSLSSGGALTGTPTEVGSFPFTVEVTDANGQSGTRAYTLVVNAPSLALAPGAGTLTLAYGVAGSQAFTASGSPGPYSYAISGTLPAGLAFSGDTLSGTPSEPGSYPVTVTATDTTLTGTGAPFTVSQSYTLDVPAPALAIDPATLPDTTAGQAYDQALAATGGVAPYGFQVSAGALPDGLALAADGALAGTTTHAGSFDFTVTATDANGQSGTRDYTVQVAAPTLSLVPGTLVDGAAGVAYSQTFVADGGIAPYAYAVASGSLPDGLGLDGATGVLSGTPTAAGSFDFAIRATDSTGGTPASTTRAYTVVVAAPTITITPATLPRGLGGQAYAELLSAAGGTAPYRFTLSAGSLPAGLALAEDGALDGTPAAGLFDFTVTATDAMGFTGTRQYAVEIVDRPDPSLDPEVRGLLEAQADSARRFASAQMGNFQQRLETLHDNRAGAQVSNRLSFVTGQQCADRIGRKPGDPCDALVASNDAVGMGSGGGDEAAAPEGATGGANSPLGAWIGGVIRSGAQDGRGGGAGADFESDGISAGLDYRFSPAFALGGGIGLGRDESKVGENGSRVDGDAYALAFYASYHPGDRFFLDGLMGYQRLSYDLRRHVTATGGFVEGSRDGSQWFGSISAGAQYQHDTWQLTPYARVDLSRADLDAYVEQGDPIYSLAYGDMDVDSTTGNLGFRFESRHATDWGAFAPQARLEYQYDFDGDSSASLQYADLLTAPLYNVGLVGFDRSRYMVGLGVMFYLPRGMSLRAEYRGLFGSQGDRDNGFMLNFEKGY
ncbi:putative Ig domain-containing protein [Lysobacter spongiae]|uniref:Putative Ig domain-containing protein n=1 Tax=Marilutibacter spongiae TaxID=2025720 RepID=A0A7W3TM37_9GAMM|nr:putative Ig domain-containing protein [Lysobacter spongiae]MBB1060845.1 putative Ig domain-containing protein [Lysobacter spongiae]